MYTVTERQSPDGHFPLIAKANTYDAAIDAAKTAVHGDLNGRTVYVFAPDHSLVAKVSFVSCRHYVGPLVQEY